MQFSARHRYTSLTIWKLTVNCVSLLPFLAIITMCIHKRKIPGGYSIYFLVFSAFVDGVGWSKKGCKL